jgi:hypothetical protein
MTRWAGLPETSGARTTAAVRQAVGLTKKSERAKPAPKAKAAAAPAKP